MLEPVSYLLHCAACVVPRGRKPWGSAQEIVLAAPLLMATALCLYSHLLSAAWSKLKPFPGRHPAPAAACESKGNKGELLALGVCFQVGLGKITDDSGGGNPASKPLLTSDWHFSSGCKESTGKLEHFRNKEHCSPACGEHPTWKLTAVWTIY